MEYREDFSGFPDPWEGNKGRNGKVFLLEKTGVCVKANVKVPYHQ